VPVSEGRQGHACWTCVRIVGISVHKVACVLRVKFYDKQNAENPWTVHALVDHRSLVQSCTRAAFAGVGDVGMCKASAKR
jgi:hypothetical protein